MFNNWSFALLLADAMAILTAARTPHIVRPRRQGNRRRRYNYDGAVAQLGERYVRNVEVVGSIPIGSTT